MKSGKANDLCLSGISNILFSYTYSGETYSRYETGEVYESTMDDIFSKVNLVLEQPFAYLWHDTKAFLDMPLYTSNYIYEDASVPFMSIVLKGIVPVYSEYVNFEANKQEFFLKLVETGTYPSFYITQESSSRRSQLLQEEAAAARPIWLRPALRILPGLMQLLQKLKN